MIAPHELRIGNWLQCDIWDNGKIEYFKVRFIREDAVYVERSEGVFGGGDGIPITPEILEQLQDQLEIRQYFLLVSDEENGLWWFGIDKVHTQIKYLHQLQNLFFCLTGEELKINNFALS